jgi:hypothetical protein
MRKTLMIGMLLASVIATPALGQAPMGCPGEVEVLAMVEQMAADAFPDHAVRTLFPDNQVLTFARWQERREGACVYHVRALTQVGRSGSVMLDGPVVVQDGTAEVLDAARARIEWPRD